MNFLYDYILHFLDISTSQRFYISARITYEFASFSPSDEVGHRSRPHLTGIHGDRVGLAAILLTLLKS